mgnify:CR=1 FL=1
MALFGSKKNKPELLKQAKEKKAQESKKDSVKTPAVSVAPKTKGSGMFSHILVQPRITEKATIEAENGVYVFEVNKDATKKEIGSAVKYYYNVTPIKVNIVKIPEKKIFSRTRGRKGIKQGGKKAYVFLKKGDKIEII